MAAWSVAVRDERGWQVCGAVMEAKKVSDISVKRDGTRVEIYLLDDRVAVGELLEGMDPKAKLDLMRWPVGDPGADPVVKRV